MHHHRYGVHALSLFKEFHDYGCGYVVGEVSYDPHLASHPVIPDEGSDVGLKDITVYDLSISAIDECRIQDRYEALVQFHCDELSGPLCGFHRKGSRSGSHLYHQVLRAYLRSIQDLKDDLFILKEVLAQTLEESEILL